MSFSLRCNMHQLHNNVLVNLETTKYVHRSCYSKTITFVLYNCSVSQELPAMHLTVSKKARFTAQSWLKATDQFSLLTRNFATFSYTTKVIAVAGVTRSVLGTNPL